MLMFGPTLIDGTTRVSRSSRRGRTRRSGRDFFFCGREATTFFHQLRMFKTSSAA
jgi:hypothetical protein